MKDNEEFIKCNFSTCNNPSTIGIFWDSKRQFHSDIENVPSHKTGFYWGCDKHALKMLRNLIFRKIEIRSLFLPDNHVLEQPDVRVPACFGYFFVHNINMNNKKKVITSYHKGGGRTVECGLECIFYEACRYFSNGGKPLEFFYKSIEDG